MFRYNHVDNLLWTTCGIIQKFKLRTISEQRKSWWSTCLKTFRELLSATYSENKILRQNFRVTPYIYYAYSSFLRWGPIFDHSLKLWFPLCPPLLYPTSPVVRVSTLSGFSRENRPFSSRNGCCVSGVSCTSTDTPAVFGVSSSRELKAKPPTIKSAPWPLTLCDFLRVSAANWLLSLTTSGEDERSVFLNTFLGVFLWTLVPDKNDSGKLNATRDKSLAAMFIFVFFFSFKLARSRHSYPCFARQRNYIEPP